MSLSSTVPLTDLRVISLPERELFDLLRPNVKGFTCVLWDFTGEPVGCARAEIDIAVAPFFTADWIDGTAALEGLKLLQLQSTGYDGIPERIGPDIALASAGPVHAAGTAELAVGLIVAAQRELDRAIVQQHEGVYERFFSRAVADSRVTVVGAGGIGSAVADRLEPFEVRLTRVASRPRDDERGRVHGADELAGILPDTDILVLALPHTARTHHLVDAALLARLPDDALVVNVGRGPVVDTAALTAEVCSGRLRCALDVVDPEPLPAGHALYDAPGAIVLPHLGGSNASYRPRMSRLLLQQLDLVGRGRAPRFLVQPGRLDLGPRDSCS